MHRAVEPFSLRTSRPSSSRSACLPLCMECRPRRDQTRADQRRASRHRRSELRAGQVTRRDGRNAPPQVPGRDEPTHSAQEAECMTSPLCRLRACGFTGMSNTMEGFRSPLNALVFGTVLKRNASSKSLCNQCTDNSLKMIIKRYYLTCQKTGAVYCIG